jgi:hypothetical protein
MFVVCVVVWCWYWSHNDGVFVSCHQCSNPIYRHHAYYCPPPAPPSGLHHPSTSVSVSLKSASISVQWTMAYLSCEKVALCDVGVEWLVDWFDGLVVMVAVLGIIVSDGR